MTLVVCPFKYAIPKYIYMAHSIRARWGVRNSNIFLIEGSLGVM